jgi:hypothetical protein
MAGKKDQNQDEELLRSELLLREADEELRREQLEAMWKRYGGLLIMACVLIVVMTGVSTYYKHHVKETNKQETNALYDWLAIEEGDKRLEQALATKEDIANTQQWLQLYYAGNDALEQQDYDKALDIYKTLRKQRELGGSMRWLADLMELRVLMQTQGEDVATLRARLEDLAAAEGNPYAALAYFDAAILAGQKQNEYAQGLELLNKASKEAQGVTALLSMINDIRHLYTMKMQDMDTAAGNTTNVISEDFIKEAVNEAQKRAKETVAP